MLSTLGATRWVPCAGFADVWLQASADPDGGRDALVWDAPDGIDLGEVPHAWCLTLDKSTPSGARVVDFSSRHWIAAAELGGQRWAREAPPLYVSGCPSELAESWVRYDPQQIYLPTLKEAREEMYSALYARILATMGEALGGSDFDLLAALGGSSCPTAQ